MTLEIVYEARDQDTGALTGTLAVGGKEIAFPFRAPSIWPRNTLDLEVLTSQGNTMGSRLVEVYRAVDIGKLGEWEDQVGKQHEFAADLSNLVRKADESGNVPFVLASLVKADGSYFDDVPPEKERDLLLDLIWEVRTPIVAIPLFGIVKKPEALKDVIRSAEDRAAAGKKVLMGTLSMTLRSSARALLQLYWEKGLRLFGIDLGGRRLAACYPSVVLAARTLHRLSRGGKEPYFLYAINTKDRAGIADYSRVNDLLSFCYGFQAFGPNHVRRRMPGPPDRRSQMNAVRLVQLHDYGYYSFKDVADRLRRHDAVEIDSPALQNVSPEQVWKNWDPTRARLVSRQHNAWNTFREDQTIRQLVRKGRVLAHLKQKARIAQDLEAIQNFRKDIQQVTL